MLCKILRDAIVKYVSSNQTGVQFLVFNTTALNHFLLFFTVPIDSIKEIRTGKSTEVLRTRALSSGHTEDCAFSILYGDDFESLDLVASTPEEANIWVTGLNALVGAHKCKHLSSALRVMY